MVVVVGLADLGHGFSGAAAFVGGPLVVGVGQDGANQADHGGFAWEDFHHECPALDLLVEALEGAGGPD